MNIFFKFYKEQKKTHIIADIMIRILKKINYISIKKIGLNYLYVIYSNQQNNTKALKKIDKKIEQILKTNKNTNIILSKEIKKIANEKFNNEKEEYLNIIQIIEYYKKEKSVYLTNLEQIMNKKMLYEKSLTQEQEIFVLTKNKTELIEKKIKKMAENYKTINVVTPNIKEFKKLEYDLEQRDEIITIINNKKKSLARAKYIINIDFNEKEIFEYNINREAIIFNISNYKIVNLKNFDGQIINNIQIITLPSNEFDMQDIYIINIQNKEVLKNIETKINLNLFKMIGNNGIIEFLLDKNRKKV